nr:MerR family transcriptional regulator [Lentilactobacillus otakiensis]
MKLTLNETAARFNVTPAVIDDYIKNGLVPSRTDATAVADFDETDMYWMDMSIASSKTVRRLTMSNS